jgi:hypothetical protein
LNFERAIVSARLLVLAACLSGAADVLAQDARPYEASAPQRPLPVLDSGGSGLFPYLESVYDGGGFTLGGGYRFFYTPRAEWDVKGLYSVRHYKLVEVATTSAGHADGRVILRARAGWRDAPQVGYYGVGMNTFDEDRVNFRLQQSYAGGSAVWLATKRVVVAGSSDFENFTLKPGRGDAPSIEFFGPPIAGLGTSPAFVHTTMTASYDSRDGRAIATTGGYYGASLHSYIGMGDAESFGRLDVQLLRHFRLHDRLVVSGRGRLESTLGDGPDVPYFLLPSVGSGATLRAYHTRRFRGPHTVLGTLEVRWLYREWDIRFLRGEVGLELAAFYDVGEAAPTLGELFDAPAQDVGVGARLHWRNTTPARVEIAKGSERWRVVFAGLAPF